MESNHPENDCQAPTPTRANKNDVRVPLEHVRAQLAKIWLIGGGLLFSLLVVQSIFGKYGEHVEGVWSWFVPTTLPTVSLMIGVLGAGAMDEGDRRTLKKSFCDIAWWLSLVYLAILAATILLEPFSGLTTAELRPRSNFWLAPLQGLVLAALGFLFTATDKGHERAKPVRD
jgi:hypothetical protein